MGYKLFITNMVETKTITSIDERSRAEELFHSIAGEFRIQFNECILLKAAGDVIWLWELDAPLQELEMPNESTLILVIQSVRLNALYRECAHTARLLCR